MKLFRFTLLGVIFVSSLKATETTNTEINFSERLKLLESKKANLQPIIKESLLEWHRLENSKNNLRYIWEKENPFESKRKSLQKMIEMALNSRIKDWDQVDSELETLYRDQEISEAEIPLLNKSSKKQNFMRCPFFPLPKLSESHKYKVLEDFGVQKDPKSGLKWKTSGWWIAVDGLTPVKNCDDGEVIYSGKIPGRGFVVLVRHKNDFMSLYAHLDESDTKNLLVGKKLTAGDTVGFVRSKLYFETRHNGQAFEPKKVFSEKQTARLN